MRIAQILQSQAWGDVTLDTPNMGLGGRETALVRLGEQWAQNGHEVTCFVPVKESSRRTYENGYVEFVPVELAFTMMKNFPFDAGVAWECPSVFSDEKVKANVPIRVTEMQVAHFNGPEIKAASDNCQAVFALSDWAAEFMIHSGLDMPREKVITLPNGVDIERYPLRKDFGKIDTEFPMFVYSSSPDRGLNHLLSAWTRIRERYPNATLYVGYGAGKFIEHHKWAHGKTAEMALEIQEGLKQPGVLDLGKIGQDKLARLQNKATAWLYPCDPINATETGCITAVEAGAAGTPMIITDADCLPSEFGDIAAAVVPLPWDEDHFLGHLFALLSDEDEYRKCAEDGRKFAESRDWSKIAPRWIETFKTLA